MQAILVFVSNLLRSKIFWIVVCVIVLYIIIKRNAWKLETIGKPRFIDYETNSKGEVKTFSESTKSDLEQLARDLYNRIDGADGWFSSDEPFRKTYYLTDQELLYVSQYYNKAVRRGKSTLYKDIDDEWMPDTDIDTKILSRLSEIGEI